RGRCPPRESVAAGGAIAMFNLDGRAASRAGRGQPGAAAGAEARRFGVVEGAAGAAHRQSLVNPAYGGHFDLPPCPCRWAEHPARTGVEMRGGPANKAADPLSFSLLR